MNYKPNGPIESKPYPGLVVCDDRVSGSITAGRSRLSLWALTCFFFEPWKSGLATKHPETYGWTEADFKSFAHHILDHRGEFARLICTLADVERLETERSESKRNGPWWAHKRFKTRVVEALRRCLYVLENDLGPWGRGV